MLSHNFRKDQTQMLGADHVVLTGRQWLNRLSNSPLAGRLMHGTLWSLVGALASRAISLVVTIIIVRGLGRELFGQFSMIQSTLTVLGTAAGMGLASTATKYIAELRESEPLRVANVLGLVTTIGLVSGLLIALGCFAIADQLAAHVLERADLAPLLKLSAFAIVLTTMDGVQSAILAGLEAFRRIAQVTIVTAALSLAVYTTAIYLDGLRGAVLAQIISAGIASTLSGWASHIECRRHGLRRRFTLAAFSEVHLIWHYSIPALGGGLTYVGVFWLGNLMLIHVPEGYAQLGTLRVVDQLRTLIMYLPIVLLSPTFSIMSNSAKNPAQLARILEYSILISGLVVFPLGLAITFLGDQILAVVYGSEFEGSVMALAFAMVVAGAQATGLGLANVINATGRMWFGFGMNLIWGLLFTGLSLLLIPAHGSTGYLAALAIAYIFLNVIAYGGFLSHNRLVPARRVFAPLALFVAAVAGAFLIRPHLNLLESVLSAIVTSIVVAAALIVLAQRRFLDGTWKA
jgi:O-antigen/teichoic acid export membrane protein